MPCFARSSTRSRHDDRDGTTDEKARQEKVAEARREEMKYFEAMGVFRKVLDSQAIERTGRRPTGITWVDVKKADGRHRSRLVGNDGIDQAMYVATPPLKALIAADS